MFARDTRRRGDGSVTVVIATDAPLLPQQLGALAKRAALGLARVGSTSAPRSGEFAIAFSTGNRIAREEHGQRKVRTLRSVGNTVLDILYEAVVEATEESSLNAICCSSGMTGRSGRAIPALPHETVLELLGKNVALPTRKTRRARS
jgi:D-aminopeptidase